MADKCNAQKPNWVAQGVLVSALAMAIWLIQDARNKLDSLEHEISSMRIEFAKLPTPRTRDLLDELDHRIDALEHESGMNR